MVGREHDDLVVALRAQPVEQVVEHRGVGGSRLVAHPRDVGHEHLVDAGVQCRRRGAAGRDEQVQRVDVGAQLLQRRAGQEHVTVAVEPDGEGLSPGAGLSHGAIPR